MLVKPLLLAFAAIVLASPHKASTTTSKRVQANPAKPTECECAAVKDLVTAANEKAFATAFCSSYMGKSTSTCTRTVSTTFTTTEHPTTVVVPKSTVSSPTTIAKTLTSTAPTATYTETRTISQTDTITTFQTNTVTSSSTSIATVFSDPQTHCGFQKKKRHLEYRTAQKPDCIRSYLVGPLASSACKCLSFSPRTTTVTTTKSFTTTTTAAKQTISSGTQTIAVTFTLSKTVQATPLATTTMDSTLHLTHNVGSTSLVTVTTIVATATTTIANPSPTIRLLSQNQHYPDSYLAIRAGTDPPRIRTDVSTRGDSAGTPFILTSNGTLVVGPSDTAYAGSVLAEDPTVQSDMPYYVYAYDSAQLKSASAVPLTCTLETSRGGYCPLTCSAQGGSTNFECGSIQGDWNVGPAPSDATCRPFRLLVLGDF